VVTSGWKRVDAQSTGSWYPTFRNASKRIGPPVRPFYAQTFPWFRQNYLLTSDTCTLKNLYISGNETYGLYKFNLIDIFRKKQFLIMFSMRFQSIRHRIFKNSHFCCGIAVCRVWVIGFVFSSHLLYTKSRSLQTCDRDSSTIWEIPEMRRTWRRSRRKYSGCRK